MKLFSLIPCITAHSWLACSDYGEKNGVYYDHAKCRGWPRLASKYAPIGATFGGDSGFDTRPRSGTSPCASARTNADYTGGHHMAVYFPGQQVVLAHPMKNHGAASCTNKYIPDNGNWIYAQKMTEVGKNDPTLSKFKENEIVDLGKSPVGHQIPDERINSYPKPGFQNAPAFCEDTDKSMGTYSFNVPRDMETGKYTFVWLWAFNSPQDYYSTCFEVEVVNDYKEREAALLARGQSDLSLICDNGPTSEQRAGSTLGCQDGQDVPPPPKPTQPAPPKPVVTTPPPEEGSTGYILSNQMTGKIILPGYRTVVPKKREIHVKFYADCANVARPNFWYAQLDHKHDGSGNVLHRFSRSDNGPHHGGAGGQTEVIHYVLNQDNKDDIERGFVGFHWAFDGGCRMLQYPTQIHVEDTL